MQNQIDNLTAEEDEEIETRNASIYNHMCMLTSAGHLAVEALEIAAMTYQLAHDAGHVETALTNASTAIKKMKSDSKD